MTIDNHMAANLDVKSESWLNLAIDQVQISNQRRVLRGQLSEEGRGKNKCKLQKRHSIGGDQNYYSPVEFNNNKQQQTQTHSSNSSIANVTEQQQHLLIRLRQRNYQQNNRSSTATLSSNLSNSVELNSTLLIGRGGENKADLSELKQPIKLKNEPRRLQVIKDKLRRSARRGADRGSPRVAIARSWSSLSERINGKLENIRHSWKHFLYQYNHNGEACADSNQPCPTAPQEVGEEAEDQPQAGQVNRSQLTNDWIARHHCFVDKHR